MKIAFDSSAFAKRYIEEQGSDLVAEALQKATELGLSILCVPEIFSALNRRRREGLIDLESYTQIKSAFVADISDATILQITSSAIQQSINLLENYPLRSMDALHIAGALVWQAELFISADHRQLEAAKQSGLTVRAV